MVKEPDALQGSDRKSELTISFPGWPGDTDKNLTLLHPTYAYNLMPLNKIHQLEQYMQKIF